MAVSSPVFESVWSDLQGVPFSQGYLDAGGVRTRYLHAGDTSKPTLVLLHGSAYYVVAGLLLLAVGVLLMRRDPTALGVDEEEAHDVRG